MTLPPALLQRLAQRGLVQKQKQDAKASGHNQVENEEVIAEDYDEMEDQQQDGGEEEYQYPPLYDNDTTVRKRDDNFWLERMKARMGEGNATAGYKGCPNKYNIYHKCTLFCVNRWEDGHAEPSREYMRRFRRMLRKYPLPKGWHEIYDPGCGVYYFGHETDGVVSWLSPTHPKSLISKSAALLRRQLEENNGEEADSDEDDEQEEQDSDDRESDEDHKRRTRSPKAKQMAQDFPSLHESLNLAGPPPMRKTKSRDLDRAMSRQRRPRGDEQRERERDRYRGRGGRHREEMDVADPMDPSSYSNIPRGKWSDGLVVGGEGKAKKSTGEGEERVARRETHSNDDESDNDNYD